MSDWWLLIRILNLFSLNFFFFFFPVEMDMTSKISVWSGKGKKMSLAYFRLLYDLIVGVIDRNRIITYWRIFWLLSSFFFGWDFLRTFFTFLICNLWSMEVQGISITEKKLFIFMEKVFLCLLIERRKKRKKFFLWAHFAEPRKDSLWFFLFPSRSLIFDTWRQLGFCIFHTLPWVVK